MREWILRWLGVEGYLLKVESRLGVALAKEGQKLISRADELQRKVESRIYGMETIFSDLKGHVERRTDLLEATLESRIYGMETIFSDLKGHVERRTDLLEATLRQRSNIPKAQPCKKSKPKKRTQKAKG